MGFDAALVIRTASAVLWVLTGAWIVWKGGQRNRWLGIAIVLSFLTYITNNLFVDYGASSFDAPWPSPSGAAWGAMAGLAGAIAAIVVLTQWSRADWPRSLWPMLAAVTVAFLGGLLTWTDPSFRTSSVITESFVVSGLARPFAVTLSFFRSSIDASLLLASYASVRMALEPSRELARRQAPLALGLGLFALYYLFNGIVYPASNDWVLVPATALTGALLVLPWIYAGVKGAGRPALPAANLFLAVALVGLLVPLLTDISAYDAANGTDPTSARGIVRTVAWAIFVYGILRTDMLGVDLRARTVKRGTLAATALAALFIVAQIMQNFLSAEYGLLTGGIIAGAVLFAANPVQKAIERVTDKAPTRGVGGGNASRKEDVYIGALRLAMRDRTLTRDEEVHLHKLAEELGIGAGRAHELMVAVEGERTRKGRVA